LSIRAFLAFKTFHVQIAGPGGKLPDVFVLNARKHSDTAPAGIFLYEYVKDEESVPVFRAHKKGAVGPPVPNVLDVLHGAVAQFGTGILRLPFCL
jgi:hypothetical protein